MMSNNFKTDNFFTFAEILYDKRDDFFSNIDDQEVVYRSIVNRAYYSCFHKASNIIEGAYVKHDDLTRRLTQRSETAAIGNRLKQLLRKRIDADYKPAITVTSSDAGKCISLARKIIRDINAL